MDIKIEKTLKLNLFTILIVLTLLCTIQNIKASEASGELMNKLANEVVNEEPFDDSLSPEDRAYIEEWKAHNPQSIDITDYVKIDVRFRRSYRLVKGMFSEDQLPLLYKLLDDKEYEPYWVNVASVIGDLSEDPNTIPILLNYFQRDDGEKADCLTKIWTLPHFGKIGGKEADSILRKAITVEGAKELSKAWCEEQEKKWRENGYDSDKENVVLTIQQAAFQGMILTGKKENWKIIEDLYNIENETMIKTEKMPDTLAFLVDAMALRDFLIENNNDIEAFYRLERDEQPRVMMAYCRKYMEPGLEMIKNKSGSSDDN